jgi:hypothetical protein
MTIGPKEANFAYTYKLKETQDEIIELKNTIELI